MISRGAEFRNQATQSIESKSYDVIMLTIEDTFSLVNRQAVEKNYRYKKSIVLKMPATGQVWQVDLWYPQ